MEELLYETIKYCTDPETAAGKAQRYHNDPVINLYTACLFFLMIIHKLQ